MTLLDTIKAIEAVAGEQPNIGTIARNDVFTLNTIPDIRYGVFAWTQGQHSADLDGDLRRYAFTLFYVDRLTESAANREEVQSVGVETLVNILDQLADAGIYAEDGYTFTTFNQRFADECAGVFCSVTFDVAADAVCPVYYDGGLGDFNYDFNGDFYVRKTIKRI